jgi:hypothetical protein
MPPTQPSSLRRSARLQQISLRPLQPIGPNRERMSLATNQSNPLPKEADLLPESPHATSFIRQPRDGIYRDPKQPLYRIVRPKGPKPPAWLAPYIQMFMSDGMGQIREWADVLSLWLRYESMDGYIEVEGTSRNVNGRMDALTDWLVLNRDPHWRPDFTQYDSVFLNDELQHYWRSIYPSWFTTSSLASDDGGQWKDWLLTGKSGWLDIMASFFFTGRVGCEECDMPGSDARVELNCPYEWYGQLDELKRVLTRVLYGVTLQQTW